MTLAASSNPENPGRSRPRAGDLVTDGIVRAMRPDGTVFDDAPRLSNEQCLAIYHAMVRCSMVDDEAARLAGEGRVGHHLSSHGFEAAIVGAAAALNDDDWLVPCNRALGAVLWRGMPLQRFFDHLYGNGRDHAKGRQVSQSWSYGDARIASVGAGNGNHIGHGVGLAWAAKLQGDQSAALSCFGESALASIDFHSALNFAAVAKAPVVFFCRHRAPLSPPDGQVESAGVTSTSPAIERGSAYGLPEVRCDGRDVLAVHHVTQAALDRARRGEGPTLVDALIEPVSPGQSERPSLSEPVERLRQHLEARGLWGEAQQHALQIEVSAELAQVVAAAESAPPPALHSIFDDVYQALPWHLQEQREQLLGGGGRGRGGG